MGDRSWTRPWPTEYRMRRRWQRAISALARPEASRWKDWIDGRMDISTLQFSPRSSSVPPASISVSISGPSHRLRAQYLDFGFRARLE